MSNEINENKGRTYGGVSRQIWLVCAGLSLMSAGVLGMVTKAYSMEFNRAGEAMAPVREALGDAEAGTRTKDPVDPCVSLLKTASFARQQESSMYNGNYAAAQASALGVVFGVRFALGPKEVTHRQGKRRGPDVGVWSLEKSESTNGYKALAVAEYRRCKNEEALKSLSGWQR